MPSAIYPRDRATTLRAVAERLTDNGVDVLATDGAAPPSDVDHGAGGPRRRRVTRWDRPPDPHDWRYFVGGLGKILIATGLLLFGFVGYQLWGTGIQTARAQNRLEDRFQAALAESGATTVPPGSAVATTAPGRPDIPNATTPASSAPVGSASAPAPTAPPSSAPTTPEPVVQDIPPIRRNEPLARLEIPKIGKDLIVVPGVDLDDLQDGPGHYPDTPLPGQLGNASIAGHRTTYGEPFRQIDELEPGDELIVTMITGETFVYAVTGTEIVAPSDYFVVATTDPNVAELTLTSCDPEFTSTNRIVVHALLDPERSAQVGVPTFYDLEADTSDSGIDATGDAASADDPVVNQTSDDATTVDVSGGVSENDAAPGVTLDRPAGTAGDAFERGWFDDAAAYPHVAMWGAACSLVAFAFSRISRRFRRYSVGVVCCIIPFVVALYFFYENINRLLPPGL